MLKLINVIDYKRGIDKKIKINDCIYYDSLTRNFTYRLIGYKTTLPEYLRRMKINKLKSNIY